RWSARNRILVLACTALLMGGLAFGIRDLRFEDDPIGAMPRGHPNTLATYNLTENFPGSAYASPVFVSVDAEKWAEANADLPNRVPLSDPRAQPYANQAGGLLDTLLGQGSGGQAPSPPDPVPGPLNITDEVYMRGMEELFLFLQDHVPEMEWGITLSSQIKLVNYTNTGVPGPGPSATATALRAPDPSAFAMPGTDPEGEMQFATAWNTYFMASPASVRSIVSADWSSTRLAFLFDPGDKGLVAIGDQVYAAVEAYKAEVAACDRGEACGLEWNVFEYDSILVDPRGAPAAASYLTKITLEDLFLLGPIAILFVGAMLFLAFRRPGTVLAMVLPLSVAGLGVLGVFGLVDIPIHSTSLLVFPVLIGTGIDFGIHMAQSFHDARRSGRDVPGAAHAAGQGAGVPLVVVTITTLIGMLLLVFAPNVLLAQLGLAIILGLSLLLVVSLTALPAALSWTSTPPARRTLLDRFLVRNAAFWGHRRVLGVALVVVLMLGSLAMAPLLKTLVVGTPAAFFPKGDAQREDFDASNERYFNDNEDLVSNLLVMEGPLATPEAMALMRDLEAGMKELPFVRDDSSVSIYFALNAWIQVRQGTAGAPLVIAQESAEPGSTFPDTPEGIRTLMDEMFATPLATYATFFTIPPDYEIGVMLVEIQQPSEFQDLDAVWDKINAKVAEIQALHPGAGLRIHLAGSSAIAYLFTAKELPYVQIASYVGLAATFLQVLLLRRRFRDAFTVSAVVVAAGLWWIGLLVLSDIPLSIGLVVPIVILEAIGSDYALHLRYAIAHEGPSAWGTVGRAVYYSAITDLGAFLVFTQMRYGLLRDATIATVYVLGCALVATLILVPIFSARRELPPVGRVAFQSVPAKEASA
ncbi:MAG TPA: MMPL family transporter, partial [Candidatus Thermoplasmatota archaeon]|nr:MMPL family transporter [Candidatus Thermoplasmatota archaeon]